MTRPSACSAPAVRTTRAFFIRFWRSGPAWERVGERWFPRFAGVILVEATKQLYAGAAVREREGKRAYVALPQGLRRT